MDKNTKNKDAVYSFEGTVLADCLTRVMQLGGARVTRGDVRQALTTCELRLTGTTAEEALSRIQDITENRVCSRCGGPQRRLKAEFEHGTGWYHGNDYSDSYIRSCESYQKEL